jgi:hypothetical protein
MRTISARLSNVTNPSPASLIRESAPSMAVVEGGSLRALAQATICPSNAAMGISVDSHLKTAVRHMA